MDGQLRTAPVATVRPPCTASRRLRAAVAVAVVVLLPALPGCGGFQEVTRTLESPATFDLRFVPQRTAGEWSLEVSGSGEGLEIVGDRVEAIAGGGADATHYARVRRKLPETDGLALRDAFWVGVDLELPEDFYERQSAYLRVLGTDNFPGVMRFSGTAVGAGSEDEWRTGLAIYANGLPRLVSDHQDREALVLWRGRDPLPVGRHRVAYRIDPAADDGAWELWIDGERVARRSGVQTVPDTVPPDERVVTRAYAGIDGAVDQTDASVLLYVYEVVVSDGNPWPPSATG